MLVFSTGCIAVQGEIKALQSQSAPDDQIAPIFALYQLVGGFLADPSTIPPAAPSSAAPTAAAVAVAAPVATPVAAQPSTAPSTSTAPAPILEAGGGGSGASRAAAQPLPEILSRGELEDRKKECKSTIKSLTASGAPDDQIKVGRRVSLLRGSWSLLDVVAVSVPLNLHQRW